MKKLMTLATGVFSLVISVAAAAQLDLKDGDQTVTTLAGVDEVVNSGDDLRILTVNVANDETFSGTISGKIRLVKEGEGFLELTQPNTYTGGNAVNNGRLIASHETALGDPTVAIEVNADCQLTTGSTDKPNSNDVTCVVFNKQETFAYPIVCSAWSKPSAGPYGVNAWRLHNIHVTCLGTILTGKISGGGAVVYLGSLAFGNVTTESQAKVGSGTVEIGGDVECPEGTVSFDSYAQAIKVTGKVTALGLYQNTSTSRPALVTLTNTGNSIGTVDIGGGVNNSRAFTASGENAYGGGVLYSSVARDKSAHFEFSKDQTVKCIRMRPGQTYTPGSLSGTVAQHLIKGTAAATLTMNADFNVTNDWYFTDAGAAKALSLVWDPPGDQTLTTVGHANAMHGTITVKGGTFEIDPYCTFLNVTKVSVEEGASLVLGSAAFVCDLELAEGATMTVADGVTLAVRSLKIGSKYKNPGLYEPGSISPISGGGSVSVSVNPSAVPEDAFWTGADAGDDDFATDANWRSGTAPNLESGMATLYFADSGAVATNAAEAVVRGVVFEGSGDFTIGSPDSAIIRITDGGISNVPSATARVRTIRGPVMPIADQVWQVGSNTSLTVEGPLMQHTSTAKLTIRSESKADEILTFRGPSDAAGAGDFAGDIEAERTVLGEKLYGIPRFRLSGYEPMGPSGSLIVNTLGSGENSLGREPYVYLTNAVVAKAIVAQGGLYWVHILSEPSSTNVLNGMLSASTASAPDFIVSANSRLVFNGEQRYTYNGYVSTGTALNYKKASDNANALNAELIFNAPITYTANNTVYISDFFETIEFNAASNVMKALNYSYTLTRASHIRFGADFAFANGATALALPAYQRDPGGYHAIAELDLQGHDQWFGSLSGGNAWTKFLSTGDGAELRISQTVAATYPGTIASNVAFTVEGTAALTLSQANAVRGKVTVKSGELALAGTEVTADSVTLQLEGGVLTLPEGETTVFKAFYAEDGEVKPLPKGRYSANDGSPIGDRLGGTGTLRVRKSDAPSGLVVTVW